MKNTFTPTFLFLVCLLPILLTGQTSPLQSQLLGNDYSLRGLQSNSMQMMTGSPLLRVSNIGSSGQDGVSIELNSLTLMNPGPALLLDCPLPGVMGSGAIRLQPSEASTFLRVSNIGSSGQDGVAIDLGEALVETYRPRISMRKPLVGGTQSAIVIEPGEDSPYLRITNIGSSGQDGIRLTSQDDSNGNSIFSTLDNDTGAIDFVRWGSVDSDSVGIRTFFDLELPGLRERISSASLESFFDVSHDLSLMAETRKVGIQGDPDFDLLVIRDYEIDTPRILERIETTIDPWAESFFDIEYDLDLGTIGKGFGNNPDNICAITKFDPGIPSLRERIQSSGDDSFFDVFVDLNARAHTHRVGLIGDPDFDLLRISSFEIDTPRILERIETTIDPWSESFFDIEYDLDLGTVGTGFGQNPNNICAIVTYDPNTPKLISRIESSKPGFQNSFFDITYKLDSNYITTAHRGLAYKEKFDSTFHRFCTNISSGVVSIPSFFDITYDLALGKETRRLGTLGNPYFDLLVVREYDKSTPKLLEKITTGNPLFADSFFDISYDLNYGGGHGAGKVQFQDLHFTNDFDPAGPKLLQRVASDDPLFADSFFDISYDLNYGGGHGAGKVAFQDIHFTSVFDPDRPMLTQKIASDDPLFADSFFDISYDLNFGGGHGAGKVAFQDLHFTNDFDPAGPKLLQRVASDDPAFTDSFFDITYDLDLGSIKTEHKDLACTLTASEPSTICWRFSSDLPALPDFFDICYDLDLGINRRTYKELELIETLDPDVPRFIRRLESSDPIYLGRALESRMDISTEMIPMSLMSSSFPLPVPPLEMRYEYDGLSRKIREVSTDLGTMTTLFLERRLSPTGAVLFISSKMELQGDLSTPGTGPLVIADNLSVNGQLVVNAPPGTPHQINGNLQVNGNFSSTNKWFKIDHPLDPDNKYLIHSCIESPDMMNVYNGNAMTDNQGYVTIQLPDYFEALNTDFRYQLTCIGQFAQAIVDKKIMNNKFVIRTDKPNVEVSWQITGIRNDPAARRDTFAVEVEKEPEMKGKRLYASQ